MTLNFAKATAAALVVSFAAGLAVPAVAQRFTGQGDDDPKVFDLGIDVTLLPQDVAGAKRYLAAQTPDLQRILTATCDNYVKHPLAAEMPQTIVFCQAILSR
jgi:hypothetical protein